MSQDDHSEFPSSVLLQTGVYAIINVVNGKRYIGSAAKSFAKRWWCHLAQLRGGYHHSRHLQRAWDKHGEQSFRFEVVERCLAGDCLAVEQRWLDKLRPFDRGRGYNISPTAGSSIGVKFTDEVKAKLSKWHKSKTLSEEHRRNIGNAVRGNKHSEEAKRKISEGHKGKVIPQEMRDRIAAKLRGRKASDETRRKISLSHIGKHTGVGRKLTEEHKRNISNAQMGGKRSEETRRKMSEAQKGRRPSDACLRAAADANRRRAKKPQAEQSRESGSQKPVQGTFNFDG